MGNNAHSYNYDPIGTRNSALDNGGDTVSNLTTSVVSDYTYDHQSRRISKKVFNSSLITQQSSFIYDGWNLICEQTSTNTSSFIPHTSSLYTWGLDLSGTLQGAGGVGGLLSQTVITPETKISYFPLADANGNAVTYLDKAGNVQAHYTYDAFGGTVAQSGDMDDDFRFRFSSKYLDDETGLYYYGYRFYDPALGRWVSRDSIEEEGDLLLYGFVSNNCIVLWDLLGQSQQSSIKAGEPDRKESKVSNEFLQNVVLDCMMYYSVNLDGKTLVHIWDCFREQKDPKSCVLDYVKPDAFHMYCCIDKAYENAMRPKNFSELDKCHLNLCACNMTPKATKACYAEFDCCMAKLGATPDPFADWH